MANPTLPICRQYTLGAVLRHSQSPSKWTPNSQRRGSKAIELGVLANLLGPWSSTGSGPLYRRLANALRGSITRGDLPAGTQLPAERLLATALNVSRTTVVAAYETLRVEDAIERRQGSGSYVRPRPQLWQWSLDEFASSVPTARGEEEISDKATHIRFTSAAPAFTDIQSPEIAEAFAVDLSQHWTGHGYTPSSGLNLFGRLWLGTSPRLESRLMPSRYLLRVVPNKRSALLERCSSPLETHCSSKIRRGSVLLMHSKRAGRAS